MSNFLNNQQIPNSWRRMAADNLCYVYNGTSMLPTFHPGQLLLVKPLNHLPNKGDVIIFSDSGRERYVVHRVVSITGMNLKTRGDNNLRVDAAPVQMDHVMGKVEQVDVSGNLRPVSSGGWGLTKAKIRWGVLWLANLVRRIFWSPYQVIRRSGLVACIWQPTIIKLSLQYENGPLIKYCFGTKTVARWWPQMKQFEVVKPFDLVIPHPEGSK